VFRYEPAVLERYPAVRCGVVHAIAVASGSSPAELLREYGAQQEETRARLRGTSVAEMPSIAAWRRAFTGFGAKPTQHRNAAEALLRRLDKHGDIPSIGTLVDIGNLVSIRHAIPVAVFDLGTTAPPITVRFADGTESFVDLGSSDVTRPEPGEVVFLDAAGRVAARRWCWRQSAGSATGPGTTEALYVSEALHADATDSVAAAVEDLLGLLRRHQPQATVQALSATTANRAR
jgi:DNA/RNA-binding domain of Phe-tRNA-synthetase-like protein